jgi:hypothetical protein
MKENKTTIRFVRNDSGVLVKTVDVAKKVVSCAVGVIGLYAEILLALLNLSIKIGLFLLLYPLIAQFVKMFIEVVSQIS